MNLKKIAKLLIGERASELIGALNRAPSDRYWRASYSQEGEDLVLLRYVKNKPGFYVDVGAHHPKRFSNTFKFYQMGWSGICIDALPGLSALFEKSRPRDRFIETAISSECAPLRYYVFNEPAVNTTNEENAKWAISNGYVLKEERVIPATTLAELLHRFDPGRIIDILSIDVEGMDLEVLRGNDWVAFRPKLIVAETYGDDVEAALKSPVAQFLQAHGYKFVAKTANSSVFRLADE